MAGVVQKSLGSKDDRVFAQRPASPPPIWEALAERAAAIPESEVAKLPPDLAENLDHYLYGMPKRE